MSSFEHIRRELSYIRGMMDGETEESQTMEGRVLRRLATLIDEWVEETGHLAMRVDELEEYVEAIDEDLDDVEQIAYDIDEVEEGMMMLECPSCQESVLVDEDIFEDGTIAEVLCPDCRTVILVNDEAIPTETTELEQEEPHH